MTTSIATPRLTSEPTSKVRNSTTFRESKKSLTSPGATIGAIIIAVLWTLPTFGLFVTSFRPAADINTSGWWTVFSKPELTIDNYIKTLNFGDTLSVGESFVNSLPSPRPCFRL
jgi:alpha-glucoside transport system permease protein